MKDFKINPRFETPELRKAFGDLIQTMEELRKKETQVRLLVYRLYVFDGYINLN